MNVVSSLMTWFVGHNDVVSAAGALLATVGALFNLVRTYSERMERSRADTTELIKRTSEQRGKLSVRRKRVLRKDRRRQP
jgi:hypothetical protein